MKIWVEDLPVSLGRTAGMLAADKIREAIARRGEANIVLATGTSQLNTLSTLTNAEVDWSRVTMFHLDEYLGLPETSPASFRHYLRKQFIGKVGPLKAVHLINGEADPVAECARLNTLIGVGPVDVALVGIGENGHLAFNDPPADFETPDSYIIVSLDEQCRQQQLGEGWFGSLDDVPRTAISMSVRQIMKAQTILCSVPEQRKAQAVRDCFQGPVSNQHPASILQEHGDCYCFLDKQSSSLLHQDFISAHS
jgi:glucosamine-6-phosphate deaminase